MSKYRYVIRNCPAFDSKYNECHSKIEPHKIYCMDCTDCVLKQIVEKCCERTVGFLEGSFIKDEILNLLQIEGVE